jgi:hypothetical protein
VRERLRDAVERELFFFATLLPVRDRGDVPRALFGAAFRAVLRFRDVLDLRAGVFFRAAPRELLRAPRLPPADGREVLREPPPRAFFAFFATSNLPELRRVQVRATCPRDNELRRVQVRATCPRDNF